MREYRIPLYDERTEEPKGTVTIIAENWRAMDWKALEWMQEHPGYMADTFNATSQLIETPFLGEVEG